MINFIRWLYLRRRIEKMEQAIADLTAQVAALQDAANRAKPSPAQQDFTPQIVQATAGIKAVADQLTAAFPAA